MDFFRVSVARLVGWTGAVLISSALVLRALLTGASAAEAPERIELPPFLVEETAKGPPWRYARVDAYEALSRCDDALTETVLEEYHRLHQLLAEILPPRLQLQLSTPQTLILHDEDLHAAAAPELVARMLHRDPGSPPATSAPDAPRPAAPGAGSRYRFLPNLRLWDRDSVLVFILMRDGSFGGRLALTQDYVAFQLKSRVPALPAWFSTGVLTLYRGIAYEADAVRFPAWEWISPRHTRALRNDPAQAPRLLDLATFFTAPPPAAQPDANVDPARLWQAQAALFVRWGLEPEGGRREALWKFAERAALEGGTEAVFRECFGFDFAAADEALAEYRNVAIREALELRPSRLAALPDLSLRNATVAEIARVKGELERLEVRYLQGVSPELADKYREQARRTLRRAYDRGEREPALLAVMGLCEADAGNDADALHWLEAAAKNDRPLRPRAWAELARLRLAQSRAAAAPDAERWLTARQAAEVLQPLFRARALHPPLPEVYEAIGEVWWRCEVAPKRTHLAVLEEGVAFFPSRTGLVLRAAELNLRHGYADDAARFVALGRSVAVDDAMRGRFAELQRQLDMK